VLIVSAHFRSLCNDSLSYTTQAYLAYNSPIVEWSIVISVSVYLSVCVSVCLRSYLQIYMYNFHHFLCMLSMAVAQSSYVGIVIRYVLLVFG